MKVSNVKYIGNYEVSITFEDGVSGIIDLSDLVNQGIFKVLRDKAKFAELHATNYSIKWSEELEIDLAGIYADLSGNNPKDFFDSTLSYASN